MVEVGLSRNNSLPEAGIDVLVCDDMGTEIADFVAAQSGPPRRVIFIHAKAFRTHKKRSASSFQDVCGQAVKNLDYIFPYTSLNPPKLASWSKPWKTSVNGKSLEVDKRIRLGEGTPESIWKKIRDVTRDPSASREVWILLAEIVQILYLIQSTWGAVPSAGASLKIFCSPWRETVDD